MQLISQVCFQRMERSTQIRKFLRCEGSPAMVARAWNEVTRQAHTDEKSAHNCSDPTSFHVGELAWLIPKLAYADLPVSQGKPTVFNGSAADVSLAVNELVRRGVLDNLDISEAHIALNILDVTANAARGKALKALLQFPPMEFHVDDVLRILLKIPRTEENVTWVKSALTFLAPRVEINDVNPHHALKTLQGWALSRLGESVDPFVGAARTSFLRHHPSLSPVAAARCARRLGVLHCWAPRAMAIVIGRHLERTLASSMCELYQRRTGDGRPSQPSLPSGALEPQTIADWLCGLAMGQVDTVPNSLVWWAKHYLRYDTLTRRDKTPREPKPSSDTEDTTEDAEEESQLHAGEHSGRKCDNFFGDKGGDVSDTEAREAASTSTRSGEEGEKARATETSTSSASMSCGEPSTLGEAANAETKKPMSSRSLSDKEPCTKNDDTSDAEAGATTKCTKDHANCDAEKIKGIASLIRVDADKKLRQKKLKSIVALAHDPHVVVDMAWALSVLHVRFKNREDIASAKDVAVKMLQKQKNAALRTAEYECARAEVLFLTGASQDVPTRAITDHHFLAAVEKVHGKADAAPEGILPGRFVGGKAHDVDDSTGLFNKALRVQMWENDECFGSLFTGLAFSRCASLDEDTIHAYIQEAIEHGGLARDAPSQVLRPRVHQFRDGPPQEE